MKRILQIRKQTRTQLDQILNQETTWTRYSLYNRYAVDTHAHTHTQKHACAHRHALAQARKLCTIHREGTTGSKLLSWLGSSAYIYFFVCIVTCHTSFLTYGCCGKPGDDTLHPVAWSASSNHSPKHVVDKPSGCGPLPLSELGIAKLRTSQHLQLWDVVAMYCCPKGASLSPATERQK